MKKVLLGLFFGLVIGLTLGFYIGNMVYDEQILFKPTVTVYKEKPEGLISVSATENTKPVTIR